MTKSQIFHTAEPLLPERRAMAERAMKRFSGAFSDREQALDYFTHVTVPHSGRWAYVGNAKTGTSSTKRFLFQLEFGVPLTVSLEPLVDINPDAVSHSLNRAGVFRSLPNIDEPLKVLKNALRLTTARHPVARALSSFSYLCFADASRSPWLVNQRLRMNAVCGFNWTQEANTPQGFVKFLDYILHCESQPGEANDNPHLRPQVKNVRPEVFQPNLIGRTENLPAFFRAIAERLDKPLPKDADLPASNSRNTAVSYEALLSKDSKPLLAKAFAADFDWLNEDVESWKP